MGKFKGMIIASLFLHLFQCIKIITNIMKNAIVSFSAFALALLFSACSKKDSGPSNTASVMFVNGTAGTTGIYAKADNTALSGVSNLAFQASSGYQNLTAGTGVAINYYLTSLGTPLCNGTADLTAGIHYSVFAGGLITSPSFLVVTDDVSAPTSGNAKVRFVNLSSDNLNEAFSIGTQKIDSNVAFNTCTPYFQVSVASSVGILAADPLHLTASYIAQLSNQTFTSGKIYTILLTGTSTGTAASALSLTVISNN
jgi:hypothetical protein